MNTTTAPGATAPLSPAVAAALSILMTDIATIANAVRRTRYFDRSEDAPEALIAEIDGLVMQCISVGIFADKAAQLLGQHSIGPAVGGAEAWLFHEGLQAALRGATQGAAA